MRYTVKLPGFEHLAFAGDCGECGIGLWVETIYTEDGKEQDVPDRTMWFSMSILEPIRTTKDYGAELYHAQFHKGGIDISYARYEHVTTVTVREQARDLNNICYERTLYSQNFWDEKADAAIKAVERVMRDGLDPDDLIMELKENE